MTKYEDVIRMVDGLSKMVNERKWKRDIAEMKQVIVEAWPGMENCDRDQIYTTVSGMFVMATEKCLRMMKK